VNGKESVFVSSGGTLDAYDAISGERLAQHQGLTGNTIPSATVAGDCVITGAGENRMRPDLQASARSNACFRWTKDGFSPIWQGSKAISHHASPVAHEGHVYFLTKTGFVHCVDLSTGEERYAERLPNVCWATPVATPGRVYFFGKDGITAVLKTGPNYELLATNRLWSADDFAARQKDAKAKAAANTPTPPEGRGGPGRGGPGGGPPLPKEELEAVRTSAVGDVVYGVAALESCFLVRTGTELICIRQGDAR
jgi:hypothetical protein